MVEVVAEAGDEECKDVELREVLDGLGLREHEIKSLRHVEGCRGARTCGGREGEWMGGRAGRREARGTE